MKIEIAKFKLFQQNKFFGSLLYYLKTEESKECPTLGTDGEKIIYNKDFWEKQSNEIQLGLLAHETLHAALGHLWRRGARDPMLFNVAADFAINPMIPYPLPSGCLFSQKFKGKSAEEIYELLKKNMIVVESGGQGKQGNLKDIKGADGSGSDKGDGKRLVGAHKYWGKAEKMSSKDKAKMQAKWKQRIQQAVEIAESSKQKGDIPAGFERLFKMLEPKEDWKTLLAEYASSFQSDYAFNPVDRRFLEGDFILPSIDDGQQLDWIAVAIDTSGSIDDETLHKFLGELKGILQSFDKVKVKLTFCDSEATKFVELTELDAKKIEPIGGGGTDFEPPFRLIEKEMNPPKCFIYLTDGYGDFPSKKNWDFDVIWLLTSDDVKVPFGKELRYD